MTDRPLALVTGGSRGIGRAICEALAPTHRVLVGSRTRAGAEAVASTLPDAGTFIAELTDDAALAAACADIEQLDVLVHNAGVASCANIADTSTAQWRHTWETNVVAVAELTRLLLPALRAAGGLVITINSGAGFTAGPGSGAYAASKFALRAFTDALRSEERGRVRVSSVHPGRVATDMQRELWAGSRIPYDPQQHLAPESVAAAVLACVQAGPHAVIDELQIRPAVQINPH